MRLVPFLAIILFLLCTSGSFAIQNSISHLKVGPMDLCFNSGSVGFSLQYGGVSMIRDSELWVHNPGWNEHYYGYTVGTREVSVKDIPGGKEAIINHHSTWFEGQHRVTLLPDRVTFEYKYKMIKAVPEADMEYGIGNISAPLIIGCPFKASSSDGISYEGTVPVRTKSSDLDDTLLIPNTFKTLSINSRIGKINIQVSGQPAGLSMFDDRKSTFADEGKNQVFWCGVLGTEMELNKEYTQTVTISITPIPEKQKVPVPIETAKTSVSEYKDLITPTAGPLVIIPHPKKLEILDGNFKLTDQTQIVVADNADEKDRSGATTFANYVHDYYGLNLKIVSERDVTTSKGMILVGEPAKNGRLNKKLSEEHLIPSDKEEGYFLKVTPDCAIVSGHDAPGSFYGMQTLKQLVAATANSVFLRGCLIDDYPTLKFRGAFQYVGKDARPFHEKLIDRIFANYKMNALVLECGYTKWDSAPQIASKFSMPKSELKKEISYAQDHFMEVIPEIQSMGGATWMFENGQNRDIAEDPKNVRGYCSSNPKSYEFLFKIYDEAIDLFKPKYFHIGHDEIKTTNEYPNCSVCKQKTVTELMIADIWKQHDYLKKKNLQMMMWGDMFVAPGEAPDAYNSPSLEEANRGRDHLPKDIIMTDWHYGTGKPEEFKSQQAFMKEGIQTIAATWYNPVNIVNFSIAAKRDKCLGLLQTSWVGYNSYEGLLKEFFDQYKAFILAAEYAWNGNEISLEDLPYKPDVEFRKQWNRTRISRVQQKGFTVDLNPLYNETLADNDKHTGCVGLGPEVDLSQVPTGKVRLNDELFQMADSNQKKSVVRTASSLDFKKSYPESIKISINQKVKSLLFLQTCAWPDVSGKRVGSYKIRYEDGSHAIIPLIYGDNIIYWQDPSSCSNAEVIWSGKTLAGDKVSLRRFIWRNPNVEKKVDSVELISDKTDAGPSLLALSGVDAE